MKHFLIKMLYAWEPKTSAVTWYCCPMELSTDSALLHIEPIVLVYHTHDSYEYKECMLRDLSESQHFTRNFVCLCADRVIEQCHESMARRSCYETADGTIIGVLWELTAYRRVNTQFRQAIAWADVVNWRHSAYAARLRCGT